MNTTEDEPQSAMNLLTPSARKTIFIDALSALQGGGQTYLINLLKLMPPNIASECRVIVLLPHGSNNVFCVSPDIEVVSSVYASRNVLFRLVWSALFLPRLLKEMKVDVLYCPGGFVSVFGQWKTAVAFRNMLPFSPEERKRFPLSYIRARLAILSWIQARSLRRADFVIFVSEFGKSVIDQLLGERSEQSAVVIPHGIADQFRTPARKPEGLDLPDRYVCYVSILDFYKAQLEVIRAWHLLRSRRHVAEKLLLIGPANRQYGSQVAALIAALDLQDEVLIIGNVAYADLPGLYQGAVINLFASSCENCPNILLEMLAAGKPVLCSQYQPMPEFAGAAAIYFDPYAPDQLAGKLASLLDDQSRRTHMGQRALERSTKFRWEESAKRTWLELLTLACSDKSEMIAGRI